MTSAMGSPVGEQKNTRVAYADWARLTAVLLVVLIHTVAPLFRTQPVNSAAFVISALLDCLAHAAVPLFVMASGMFLLDERRPVTPRRAVTHYALPLMLLYVFWSAAYALANTIILPLAFEHAVFSGAMLRGFCRACVEGAYHLWYLPMQAMLYLITPLLRQFVKRDTLSLVKWFLGLAAVFQFLLPLLLLRPEAEAAGLITLYRNSYPYFVLGYPAYFVAGWVIANYRPARRWPVYVAGAAALAVMSGLTLWVSARRGEAVKDFLEPLSLFCGVYAVALFAFFAWELTGSRGSRLLTGLSRLTFGVYIIHVEIIQLFKLLVPYTGHPAGYILLQWSVVTVLSFGLCRLMLWVPGLRRTLRG